MNQFFGDIKAYNLFNDIAYYVLILSSLLLYKYKRNAVGALSKTTISFISSKSDALGKIATVLLISVESFLVAFIINRSTYLNSSFGTMVGTGANYFATLILVPIALFAVSLVILANPIKQIDIYTLILPIYLVPVKLACFFHGCCWGIPWEYGLYNHNPYHPGKQVPVQAIEAFLALLIFVFLFFYRKKAKPGTMYPMYLMLYCITRFPVEFLSGSHKSVSGPFNVYHKLCAIGFIVGLILFFVVKKYNDKLRNLCEIPEKAFEAKIIKIKEDKAQKIADEETVRLARLEKAKLARAKAKARKK